MWWCCLCLSRIIFCTTWNNIDYCNNEITSIYKDLKQMIRLTFHCTFFFTNCDQAKLHISPTSDNALGKRFLLEWRQRIIKHWGWIKCLKQYDVANTLTRLVYFTQIQKEVCSNSSFKSAVLARSCGYVQVSSVHNRLLCIKNRGKATTVIKIFFGVYPVQTSLSRQFE